MDPQQYGNIKSSSTTHCLIYLPNYIYKNLELRKTLVALTFIDFHEAFNFVHHTIIINKAISLCLHPNFVVAQRPPVTKKTSGDLSGSHLNPQPFICRISQGTRVGPLCFFILINDTMTDTNVR